MLLCIYFATRAMSRGHSSRGTTFRLPTNGNQRYTLSPAAVQGSVRYCSS